jgi:hypothetical protein
LGAGEDAGIGTTETRREPRIRKKEEKMGRKGLKGPTGSGEERDEGRQRWDIVVWRARLVGIGKQISFIR